MNRIEDLKVFYELTKGPKHQKIYKDSEPFFIHYHLEPNQTCINLNLLKRIISSEINPYTIEEFRYLNPTKKGFIRITDKTSIPMMNLIYLKIQLKEPEPEEFTKLDKLKKELETKIKDYEDIKNKIKEVVDDKKIDLYFLYAFPMVETENIELNSIITYHLEISKLIKIYKNSKKGFNTMFESCNQHKLEEAIRATPKIIHISCHGKDPNKNNGYALVLEDRGYKFELTAENLEKILANLQTQLKQIDLVVLSSCHSEVAGKLFLKYGVGNVIYINKNFPITNTASLNFAISFYQKLIDGFSIEYSFNETIKYLNKQDKLNKKSFKCCCYFHKHNKKCCLKNKNVSEYIHKNFHVECNCNFEEYNKHYNSCSILANAKIYNKKNRNKDEKLIIKEIDANISVICCGCFEEKEDLHHKGETFKFKYEKRNEESGDIKVYRDNKSGGVFNKNKNCYEIHHLSEYEDNFLFLIGNRDKAREIAEIIQDDNSEKQFFIIYGEKDVGKYNFAKSVCIYLFERNIIDNFYVKRARSIDVIKGQIDKKFEEGKYVFIIEIDVELQTPINLVYEILNEKSLFDKRFYFFILLRTTKDKIEININQEKFKLIDLKNLTPQKAMQLLGELGNVHDLKKNYLTDDQLIKLIEKKKYLRHEMLPLLKLIYSHDNYESIEKELNDNELKKKCSESDISNFIEKARNIIFLLYIMNKGLPKSVIILYEPNFEEIIKLKNSEKYFCPGNHNYLKISKSEIHYDDISCKVTEQKRKELIEKCVEIFAKLLFHLLQKNRNNLDQNYLKPPDIEFYFNNFFENLEFWKTFNNLKYEECFKKDENSSAYEKIILKNEINLEDIRDNIYNLFDLNVESINSLYSENENSREYLEQILIMLPRLFVKKESEIKEILKKCKNFLKKIKNINRKNIIRINLFSIIFSEDNEINTKDFDKLDINERAYAYFINGIRINRIIYKYFRNEFIKETKKFKLKEYITLAKDSFDTAKSSFENNTMKAHCYFHIGNLFYRQKNYEEAEKNYKNGRALKNISEFIKGLIDNKLATLFIENIHIDANNKLKFEEVVQEMTNMKDIRFILKGKELKKEMEEKFLPDIIMLNSNPLIREKNYSSQNNNIQASPNNQYYLMNKLYDRNDIKTNLIIKYKVLNEENLREAFTGKGKILILQSDDYNEAGDILLESHIGTSYTLSNSKFFSKIKKINYDILILCYINSGKSIGLLENKTKYLITFDSGIKTIFNDIGDKAILEYNKLSIDFLEHFIVNISSDDVIKAFDNAYKTFESSFKKFCRKNTHSQEHEKIKFINLTINQSYIRNKKNACIINQTGKKNIQFIPYPLLKEVDMKFSFVSGLNNDISLIIKTIIQNIEDNYYEIFEKKKKSIEINIIKMNDKQKTICEKLDFTTNKLVAFEILRFLFRHHEFFNSLLFKYYKNVSCYSKDLGKLRNLREENSSGIGLIVIKVNKCSKINIEILPRFVYLYLLNEPGPKKAINYFIQKSINVNGNESDDDSENKKTKNKNKKRKKNKNNTTKKGKIKNWDSYSSKNKSNGNLKLEKNNPNSVSQFSLNEPRMKIFEDKEFGFLVYNHEDEDDKDDEYTEDDKDNDDSYLSQDD